MNSHGNTSYRSPGSTPMLPPNAFKNDLSKRLASQFGSNGPVKPSAVSKMNATFSPPASKGPPPPPPKKETASTPPSVPTKNINRSSPFPAKNTSQFPPPIPNKNAKPTLSSSQTKNTKDAFPVLPKELLKDNFPSLPKKENAQHKPFQNHSPSFTDTTKFDAKSRKTLDDIIAMCEDLEREFDEMLTKV